MPTACKVPPIAIFNLYKGLAPPWWGEQSSSGFSPSAVGENSNDFGFWKEIAAFSRVRPQIVGRSGIAETVIGNPRSLANADGLASLSRRRQIQRRSAVSLGTP